VFSTVRRVLFSIVRRVLFTPQLPPVCSSKQVVRAHEQHPEQVAILGNSFSMYEDRYCFITLMTVLYCSSGPGNRTVPGPLHIFCTMTLARVL